MNQRERDPALVLQRSARCRQIVQYLAEHPATTHGEIRQGTSIPASTLTGCLTRLEATGIIATDNVHGYWGRRGYPQHYTLTP